MPVSGRQLPVSVQPKNGNFQYIPDLQAKFLNVRCSAYSGHPSKLLRYFPLKGRNAPLTHRSHACQGRTAMQHLRTFPSCNYASIAGQFLSFIGWDIPGKRTVNVPVQWWYAVRRIL